MNVSEFETRRQQLQAAEDRRLVHEFASQHYLDASQEQQIADYCRDHQRPGAKSAQFTVPRSSETQPTAESESQRQLVSEMVEAKREANPLLDALGVGDAAVAEMLRDDPQQRAQRQQDAQLRDDLTQLARQFGLSGSHVDRLIQIARSR